MSDTIYREDAIKAVKSSIADGWGRISPVDACQNIRCLPSADRPQGEWIPCSERVPKIGEVVLVTWEWKCKKYITTAYMVTIRGVIYWDSKQQHEYEPLNVLAWMPLPKPWKGADDGDQ